MVASQAIFKIKKDDEGNLKLKGRIVVYGNRDTEPDKVRAEWEEADMGVLRMLLSIGTRLGFTFGSADIKGALMHNGPITREVCVSTPRECARKGE